MGKNINNTASLVHPGDFGYLYEKYSPIIYGLVLRAVGSDSKASAILIEIYKDAWYKICIGEINVSNCLACLLALSRRHIAVVLQNAENSSNTVNDDIENCLRLILVKGYSLEDMENKLNLSRSEAQLALRKALKK